MAKIKTMSVAKIIRANGYELSYPLYNENVQFNTQKYGFGVIWKNGEGRACSDLLDALNVKRYSQYVDRNDPRNLVRCGFYCPTGGSAESIDTELNREVEIE